MLVTKKCVLFVVVAMAVLLWGVADAMLTSSYVSVAEDLTLPPALVRPVEFLSLPSLGAPVAAIELPMVPPTPPAPILPPPPMPAPMEIPPPPPVPLPSQRIALSTLPNSGMMFLTFDDGWGRDNIRRILDALKEYQMPSTLFVIGHRLRAYPDLWRRAVSEGHEIAYHSMTHEMQEPKSSDWIARDIQLWEDTARAVLGEDYVIPKIARLPGGSGHRNPRILRVFNERGYWVVGWSADTLSGARGGDLQNIANYVLGKSRAGAIVLQHFTERDSRSLPLFLGILRERAKREGFQVGRLSEGLIASGKLSQPQLEPPPRILGFSGARASDQPVLAGR